MMEGTIFFIPTQGGTMARTVVAIYDDLQAANRAVRELVDSGIPRDNISVIAHNRGEGDQNVIRDRDVTAKSDTVADETGAGAGVGAGIGAAIGGIGGLLVGLGALTIPGIGPVIAAGPLAVALSTLTGAGVGAVAGGVTGGLLGALIGLGIPEEEAGYYAEGVRRGGVLVTVQADDVNTDRVMDVLNRYNPMDINERAAQWRSEGWTGYDPNASTSVDTSRDRMTDQPRSEFTTDRDRTLDQGTGMDTDLDRNRTYGQGTGMGSDYDPNRMGGQDVYGNRGQVGSEPIGTEPMSGEHMGHEHMGHESDRNVEDEFDRRTVESSIPTTGGMTGGMAGNMTSDFDTTFDRENPLYRRHYDMYLVNSGYPYESYIPAYQYGYNLRSNARYQNRDWDMIETDVRTDWEREHPGTWDRFKMAIRNAWEDVTGQNRY
jgi:hypothetical protein